MNIDDGITSGGPATQIQGVVIDSAPPTAGEVLTATSAATASFQEPSGGLNYRTFRSTATSFLEGGVTGPIACTFATPFADNLYTVQVTIVCEEVAPETPTVTQFPSAGASYVNFQTTPGVGINVWVSNNDSGAHTGYVNVVAIHD